MTRVKGATHAIKRRRKIFGRTKGYRFGRSTKEKEAKQAMIRAGQHAFSHRRKKKGVFRRLWQTHIGAASKAQGLSYSVLIDMLNKKNVGVNRKMLSEIAGEHPETFNRIIEHVK
jgi:large subunit ribosomal protein L20